MSSSRPPKPTFPRKYKFLACHAIASVALVQLWAEPVDTKSLSQSTPQYSSQNTPKPSAPARGDTVTLAKPATMPIIIQGQQAGSVQWPVGRKLIFLESKADGTALVRQSDDSEPFLVPQSSILEIQNQLRPTLHPAKVASQKTQWKWIIDPQYDVATPFGPSGLAWVKKGDEWLVIDRQGKQILKSPFHEVEPFSEHGCAKGFLDPDRGHHHARNLTGMVGPSGTLVLKPEWEEVGELINGFVPVKRDAKWGYADKTGKLVIPCEWDEAWRFSAADTAVITREGKRGFIDSKGKLLVEPAWDGAINFAEEGIGAVRRSDAGWALIDKRGQLLCEPEWQMRWASRRFDLGWIPVWKIEEDRERFGLLGKDGNILVDPEWDGFIPASGGVFLYKNEGEGIFVGKDGERLLRLPRGISGIPDMWIGFSEGLAIVSAGDEAGRRKQGFINEQGELAVAFRTGELLPFSEDLAAHKLDGKWGFINRSGVTVVAHEWEEVRSFSENHAAVQKNGNWGFIDTRGKVTVTPEWDTAGDYSNGLAAVAKGVDEKRVWTFLNVDGSAAFTVDSEIQLFVYPDTETRVSAKGSEFPKFSNGYLKGLQTSNPLAPNLSIWIDRTGQKGSRNPEVRPIDSDHALSKLPVSFAPRYLDLSWNNRWTHNFEGDALQYDLKDSSDRLLLTGVSPSISRDRDLIPYPGLPAYGWIDESTGQVVMKPTFDYVRHVADDRIVVRKEGRFGVCNHEGKFVLAPEWDNVSIESNGMLVATRSEAVKRFTPDGQPLELPAELPESEYVDFYGPDFIVRQADGKYSLCHTATGEIVTFQSASRLYWNANQAEAGLLWIEEADTGKWSLIRRDGTPTGYTQDEMPTGWMLRSKVGEMRNEKDRIYYIDTDARPVSGKSWDRTLPFQHGFAAVYREGKGWGFIGEDGRIKIPPEWDEVRSFNNVGTSAIPKLVASVARERNESPSKNHHWGLIDANGRVIFEPQLDYPILPFQLSFQHSEWSVRSSRGYPYENIPLNFGTEEGDPPYTINKFGNRNSVTDAKGNELIPPEWQHIVSAGNDLFICWSESEGALITRDNKSIFRDTEEIRLVRMNKRFRPRFSRPVVFIERQPHWGYVKVVE